MEFISQPNQYGKRRYYDPEFKQKLALQVLKDNTDVAQLTKQNSINNN